MKHTGFTIVALMISMTVAAEFSSAQDRPGCAQSEFTRFAALAGDWRVHWTDRIAPEMYTNWIAGAKIEKDQTDCVLIEHFTGKRDRQIFTANSLLSFGNPVSL